MSAGSREVTFTKQSIEPNIYYARIAGYPRLFAELRKEKGDTVWTIEFVDGFPGKRIGTTLYDAMAIVRLMAKEVVL